MPEFGSRMQNSGAGKSPNGEQRGAGVFQPTFLGLPGSVMQLQENSQPPLPEKANVGTRTPGTKIKPK